MRWVRTADFLPLVTLIIIVAALSYTTMASASLFSMPFDNFRFGGWPAADTPGTVTTVQKGYMPFQDLSQISGLGMPFGGYSPFASPYETHKSYKQTVVTPEGPKTRIVDQNYDGHSGDQITTVTNL